MKRPTFLAFSYSKGRMRFDLEVDLGNGPHSYSRRIRREGVMGAFWKGNKHADMEAREMGRESLFIFQGQ